MLKIQKTTKMSLVYSIPINTILAKKIVFPFYHLVSNEQCPHIRNLYPVKSISKFEEELDFFQKYFEPITLNEILTHIENGTQPQKPSFFLSFDDGLKECHSIIAPILIKRNLKAAFFINTDFVDNQALFFRYKVSLLIEQLKNKNTTFSKEDLLNLKYSDTQKINQLAKDFMIDFQHFLEEEKPYLGWGEIKDLHEQGFTIGAHSKDHPMYAQISLEEQIHQTQNSMDELVNRLNLNHRFFSFPFTDSGVHEEFFQWMHQNGNVDLSFGTAGIKDDEFPRNLQRIPMDNNLNSTSTFILKNTLFYQLKKFLRKNKVMHTS